MSLFEFLKRLLSGGQRVPTECPNCGFEYSWNGRRCTHCHFPNHGTVPSSTENRDYSSRVASQSPAIGTTPATTREGGSEASEARRSFESTQITGLDTEKFAPISADEALELTKSADWKTAYLDPLNVIPSPDLVRVRVIDQTMVGLGLISENELAQIHKVGEEYNKYRKDFLVIEEAGAAAITQSREEKARLIAQKKREAAERKQAHAEAVAHRRATDIVFLGRGVSKGLADRRSHVERLNQLELPVLATPAELAAAMELPIPRLRWLAFHTVAARQSHYVYFKVPKKSGGLRTLAAPHKSTDAAQRWVLENVLARIDTHDNAHGFVKNRSIVTNAQPHVGADVVVNVDLTSFFPSITFWRVEGLFRSFGYSPAVATIMALLCTECPRETVRLNGKTYFVATGPRGLPQGACTSPAISNLVSRNLDKRLNGIAQKLGWNYTRYADDITFSFKPDRQDDSSPIANGEKQVGYLLARIRHICDDEGFSVNESKTRVLRNHARQSVTGIVVNDQLGVNRKTVRQLRAILNNAQKTGLASQNRENKEDFAAWLNGMISFVEMVNGDQGQKLRKQFDAVTAP